MDWSALGCMFNPKPRREVRPAALGPWWGGHLLGLVLIVRVQHFLAQSRGQNVGAPEGHLDERAKSGGRLAALLYRGERREADELGAGEAVRIGEAFDALPSSFENRDGAGPARIGDRSSGGEGFGRTERDWIGCTHGAWRFGPLERCTEIMGLMGRGLWGLIG